MIRNKTARNLALRWASHAPGLARLATDGEISEDVLQAAQEVRELIVINHAKDPNKANRIEAHKARMLVDYLARRINTTINYP